MILVHRLLYFSLCALFFIVGDLYAKNSDDSIRPFYEYKGNYGKEVESKKTKFKSTFGYNLVNMGRNWSPIEIDIVHAAFNQLPPSFHKIPSSTSL